MTDPILHFWNPDRPGCNPKTVQDAARICLRLADESAPPDPKFRTFLTTLFKEWPTQATLSGPDDPRAPVWPEWFGCPLSGLDQNNEARLSLPVASDGGLPLFVSMIEAAQQAGLVAFDDSNGWLWLPPTLLKPQGTILPRDNAAQWKRFVKEVRQGPRAVTRGEMVKDLTARVRRLLEPQGWTLEVYPDAVDCYRHVASAGVWQNIALSTSTAAGPHRFTISEGPQVFVQHDAFDKAVVHLQARYPEACGLLTTASRYDGIPRGGQRSLLAKLSDINARGPYDQPIDTAADRQRIETEMRDHILPLVNDYLTPKALNALMDSGEIKRYLPHWCGDPDDAHFDSRYYDFLFFAWMNRSPRVPRLCEAYLKSMTQRITPTDSEQNLIEFFMTHEPPDVGQFDG